MSTFKENRLLFSLFLLLIAEFFLYPRKQIFGVYVSIVDVIALLVFILSLPDIFKLNKSKLEESIHGNFKFFALLILLMVSGLIAVIFSHDISHSAKKFFQFGENIFLSFLTVISLKERGERRIVAIIILYGVFFETLLGWFQFLTNFGDVSMGRMVRISGLLGNNLAIYLLAGFIISLDFLINESKGRFDRYTFVAGSIFCGLILVQVRIVWFLTVLTLVIFVLLYNLKSEIIKLCNVLMVGLGIFVVLLMIRKPFEALQLKTRSQLPEYAETLKNRNLDTAKMRFYLWHSAFEMFKHNPITGIGLGNYGKFYLTTEYSSDGMRVMAQNLKLSTEIDAHSSFFTRLAELGLVGIIAFGTFYYFLILWSWQIIVSRRGILDLSIPLIFFISFISDIVFNPLAGKFFWIFFGLLWLMIKDFQQSKEVR